MRDEKCIDRHYDNTCDLFKKYESIKTLAVKIQKTKLYETTNDDVFHDLMQTSDIPPAHSIGIITKNFERA